MLDDQAEHQIQAQVEALVNLDARSVPAKQAANKDMLTWSPPEQNGVSLGESRPLTFINDRLIPANVFRTADIKVYTEANSLGEHRQMNISGNWTEIEPLLLTDQSPVMVEAPSEAGKEPEHLLKTLRVIQKDGVRVLYYVDMLQADNLTALENPDFATKIDDANSFHVYPAVVRIKDLRREFKGIGTHFENRVAVALLSYGGVSQDTANAKYLKPFIARAEDRLWPQVKK